MPTKFELNEIYLHHLTIFQVPIGGVFNYSFWTSTEYDFGKAYKQTFGVNPTPGAQGLNGKTRSGSGILSVRSF